MKTTYVYKNNKNNDSQVNISDTYLKLEKLNDTVKGTDNVKNIVSSVDKIVEELPASGGSQAKKAKKSNKGLLIACAAFLLVVAVFGGSVIVKKNNEKKLQESYLAYTETIQGLFENDYSTVKGGVDTMEYYLGLQEYALKGIDTSANAELLDNIDTYYSDVDKINSLNNPDLNPYSEEYQGIVESIEGSIEVNYTLPGLQNTLLESLNQYTSISSEYESLKQAIMIDMDNHVLDTSKYTESVNNILYYMLSEELGYMMDCYPYDMAVLDAQSNLEAAKAIEVENEFVEDKKLKKKERKARDEAIAARAALIAEAESVLADAEEASYMAHQTLRFVQDNIYGTSTYVDAQKEHDTVNVDEILNEGTPEEQ